MQETVARRSGGSSWGASFLALLGASCISFYAGLTLAAAGMEAYVYRRRSFGEIRTLFQDDLSRLVSNGTPLLALLAVTVLCHLWIGRTTKSRRIYLLAGFLPLVGAYGAMLVVFGTGKPLVPFVAAALVLSFLVSALFARYLHEKA